jgi:hypothetical protein
MGDWTVDVDEETNRLYIDLNGALGDEGEHSTQAVVDGAAQLDPGFDVITDIRGYRPSGNEETLARGKRAMRENGCSAAVRVMPESTTASMHFERVGDEEEAYPVAEAGSVEEAEQLLDERRKQDA